MSATTELIQKLRDAGNNGPGISPEDLLAAADALAAVQQPNRDAVMNALALHFAVPAWWGGKEFGRAADAVLAALAVPVTGETEWEERLAACPQHGTHCWSCPRHNERRRMAGNWEPVEVTS